MGGAGYAWTSGLRSGVYPPTAPHGFANRRWRLAGALVTLGDQLDAKAAELELERWCLGTRGDTDHIEEAEWSEHNACVLGPDGVYLVLAIDVIEELVDALDLDAVFAQLYRDRDPRVFSKGYNHHNNRITLWGGKGETKYLAGDVGHGHYSLTQGAYPGGRGGYLEAMDSTDPWLSDVAVSGAVTNPEPVQEDDMATFVVLDNADGKAYVGDLITRRWIPDEATRDDILGQLAEAKVRNPHTGEPYSVADGANLKRVANVGAFGVLVGTVG